METRDLIYFVKAHWSDEASLIYFREIERVERRKTRQLSINCSISFL